VRRGLAAAFLAVAVSGCASHTGGQPVGRDFSRAPFASFTLDSTSVAEAEAALGPPMKLTTVRGLVSATSKGLVPGTPLAMTELNYYFFPNGTGVVSQGHPGKFASLVFFNGRLIAYGGRSSLPGDADPPIDEARLDSLHQCRTTRRQAIALLGQPDAESLHMFDAQPGAVDIIYTWQNTQPGGAARRSLRVFFDRSGAMSNYTLVDNEGAMGTISVVPHPVLPTPLPPACPNIADRQHT